MVLKKEPISWGDCPLVAMAIAGLSFQLTDSQEKVLTELWEDALNFSNEKKPVRMTRLLQGDVSSGKTVVAYLLGLGCMESPNLSNVVTLLAPTKILANQHQASLSSYISELEKSRKFFQVDKVAC